MKFGQLLFLFLAFDTNYYNTNRSYWEPLNLIFCKNYCIIYLRTISAHNKVSKKLLIYRTNDEVAHMFLGLSWYFILMDFYLYSFFGWIYESSFCSIKAHKLTNRGFLIGPLLPLYGFGGTIVYVFLRPLAPHPSLLYLGGMLLATAIEYFTSWGMEKLFHAQWWDYSNDPYNYEGRIALVPSMFWGFLSLLAFDFLQPALSSIIHSFPRQTGLILLTVVTVIVAADLIYTLITTINFRNQLEALYRIRNELVAQLEEERFSSLRQIIFSRIHTQNERAEGFLKRLEELKETCSGEDSKLAEIEQRFREYKERHASFQKKNPFFGNKRIMQAFPTLKFIPESVRKTGRRPVKILLKDFLLQITEKEHSEK